MANAGQMIHSLICCFSASMSELWLVQDFSIPLCWSHPSGAGLTEPFRGSTSSEAQTSGGPGRMVLARNTATSTERVASPCIDCLLHVKKRSTLNTRGGTNQTNLLPHGRKGQSVTKALLLWGVLWSAPPPNRPWVTTIALDMGQAEGKHGDITILRTKTLFLILVGLWRLFNKNLFG